MPGYGDDAHPSLLIEINNGATGPVAVYSDPTQGPYEGSDDAYLAVYNNTSGTQAAALTTIAISDTYSNSNNPFWFDGDGITTYGASTNIFDNTGYGGPRAYFTGYSNSVGSGNFGTVNFLDSTSTVNTGLQPGEATIFSLETPPSNLSGISVVFNGTTPEPSTLALLGWGRDYPDQLRVAAAKAIRVAKE